MFANTLGFGYHSNSLFLLALEVQNPGNALKFLQEMEKAHHQELAERAERKKNGKYRFWEYLLDFFSDRLFLEEYGITAEVNYNKEPEPPHSQAA